MELQKILTLTCDLTFLILKFLHHCIIITSLYCIIIIQLAIVRNKQISSTCRLFSRRDIARGETNVCRYFLDL